VLAFAAVCFCVGAAQASSPPQATVIGDSVLTAVEWNAMPLATLTQGIDVRLDIGICRRLTGVSCPFDGGTVPTLLDVVHQQGSNLGTTVLVEVGYNDPASTFADDVEQSIDALLQAGVKHILWANLHGFGPRWTAMNADLEAAAKRHSELAIIDWNDDASNHWSWFQGDSIHLRYDGAMAIASLFHTALIRALAPPFLVATRSLPPARVGHRYSAHLEARGGIAPYTWRIVGGPLPRGLTLRPGGAITGSPRRSGVVQFGVQATDAVGQVATARVALRERS
jgi:hypothetical protein